MKKMADASSLSSLHVAVGHIHSSFAWLHQIALNVFRSSFLPWEKRQFMAAEAASEIAAIGASLR